MKKIFAFLVILFFLGCSPRTTMTPLKQGFYIGEKRGLISYYVVLSIANEFAYLETYTDFKGETLFYDFEKKGFVLDSLPQLQLYTIIKDNDSYVFSKSSAFSFRAVGNGEKIVIQKPIKIILNKVDIIPKEFKIKKNLALFYFSWHSPHVILGYKEKFDFVKERYIINKTLESNLNEMCDSLEYKDYEMLFYETLKKINKNYEK